MRYCIEIMLYGAAIFIANVWLCYVLVVGGYGFLWSHYQICFVIVHCNLRRFHLQKLLIWGVQLQISGLTVLASQEILRSR